jgi:phosphoglycerate dehydrogenase-like enzyme
VSYWSRTPRAVTNVTYRELDDLLASSDLLVVTLPLTPETAGLLGAARLALLPAGARLVNVARGGIVDEPALYAALDEGRLAGAALDVFENEPPLADSPLRTHENVLLSPHVAGGTREAQLNIVSQVMENLTAAVTGKPVINVVNGLSPEIHHR